MPVDLTPEAIDALEKRLKRWADSAALANHFIGKKSAAQDCAEAADTIAALRAAPVAMRERIARAEDDAYARGEMGNPGHRIRATPLDAPAPVDPVAEAARVLLDAHRSALLKPHLKRSAREMALVNLGGKRLAFLAQETPHDRP